MTRFRISDVVAREVLDSRGTPTVEVDVFVCDEFMGRAMVPSGKSKGTHEALELRDGDAKHYGGYGVRTAIDNVVHIIRPEIIGKDVTDQESIDRLLCRLDGTPNKERLGANAILGVSIAVCRAAANAIGIPLYRYIGGITANLLPVPMMNILNGGKHATNNVPVQEFMVVPAGAESWEQAMRWGAEIYHALRYVLKKEHLLGGVGDEGGFAPNLDNNEQALEYMKRAIASTGLVSGRDVFMAIDAAATDFHNDETGKYKLEPNEPEMTTREVIERYKRWVQKYDIISIEDGLDEHDWAGWKVLTEALGQRVQLIGDDIFVTNPEFLKRGIEEKVANAILIKLNQIGTVTETLDVMRLASQHGMNCIISHRSGETEDSFIADFTVGTSAGQMKSGAPARSERVAKYNELVRIADSLSNPRFAGMSVYRKWARSRVASNV